jgi:hypothetical protein
MNIPEALPSVANEEQWEREKPEASCLLFDAIVIAHNVWTANNEEMCLVMYRK